MNVTKTQIEQARNADVIELVQKLGYEVKRHSNNEYQMVLHDSLKLSRKNGWYWNSRGIGGNAIDFLMMYPDFQYDFIQAVKKINMLNDWTTPEKIQRQIKSTDLPVDFHLPIAYKNNKCAIEYLNSRGINNELIEECIKKGLIYETYERNYHNVIFVGYDQYDNARYGFCRGISQTRFATEIEGSNKKYAFKIIGTDIAVLHVFEAAIDALSYLTMHRDEQPMGTMLSLGGTWLAALDQYVKDMGQPLTIYVHTDNDKAGHKCFQAIYKKYGLDIPVLPAYPHQGKDCNDELLILKGKCK